MHVNTMIRAIWMFVSAATLLGCGGDTSAKSIGAGGASAGDSLSLVGAGATFPAPIFQKWFADYAKQNPGVRVNYQGLGSGAGVNKVIEGTVDFGASDSAMKDEEI